MTPGLALDGLDEEGHRLGGDRRPQGVEVAVGDDVETGCERPEVVTSVRVGRERDDRRRASVEVAIGDDDARGVRGTPLTW